MITGIRQTKNRINSQKLGQLRNNLQAQTLPNNPLVPNVHCRKTTFQRTSTTMTSATYPLTTRSYMMKKDRRWYERKGIGKQLTVRERKTNSDNLQLSRVPSGALLLMFNCEACLNFSCLDCENHRLPKVSLSRANEARTHKSAWSRI